MWKPADLQRPPTYEISPQFDEPFSFIVRVPAKNQPYGVGDLPETCHVRWDGCSLLVGWVQSVEEPSIARAGLIARDVILEALKAAGLEPTSQPPNLTHQTLRITAESSGSDIEFQGTGHIKVSVPVPWDVERLADLVFGRISFIQTMYYDLANERSLEQVITFSMQDDLDNLLRIQYERADLGSWRSAESWKRRWRLRHWRAQSRQLIARIWLAVSHIRAINVSFSDLLDSYHKWLTEGEPSLFSQDQEEMERDVKNLDLAFAERRAEELGSRLDNRALVGITLAAAIVAVLVGAVATAWIAHHI